MRFHLATSEEWRNLVATSLEQMGIACWEYDLLSGELWWSDNAGPLLGRPPGFTPRDFEEANAVFEADDGRPVDLEEIMDRLGEGPIEVERRALLPDGTPKWTHHRYFRVDDDAGRPVRLLGLMTDIDETKRREQHRRLLLEASRALGSSLDYETTLTGVGDTLVPDLADWCAVHLVEDGELRPVVIAHRDPAKVSWARELLSEYPARLESPAGTGKVVREGKPELFSEIGEEMLRAAARDERHLDLLRSVGFTSAMIVPLVTPDRVAGAITLASAESGVRYGRQDLSFAQELAARIAAAIENSRLHAAVTEARDTASRTAERLSLLQRITTRLSQAYSEEEVTEVIVKEVLGATAAERGVLLFQGADGQLELLAAPGYPEETKRSWGPELVSGRGGPIARAFRQVEPVYVQSRERLRTDFPELGEFADRALGESWAALPIFSSEGTLGVIGLAFDEPREFVVEERELVEALVRECGVALERARLFESQRAAVDALQRGLIPDALPELGAVRLAAHYEVGGLAKVGGDWYDAFLTDAGTVALVVGDVVGRGIPAVSTMAQLRNGLRAFLLEGHPPGEALTRVNRLFATRIPRVEGFATVFCILYDPAAKTIRWSRAGHPPVIVRPPGGELKSLKGPADGPLGVQPGQAYGEEQMELEWGTLLVLYTDGLIERRDEDLATSLERLRAAVADAPEDPDAVVGHLLSRLPTDPTPDDVAVLVAELLPPDGAG